MELYNYSQKSGFTLAEVLITLGIIGVVAAITLPILIANYQKKVTEERLKQVYSVLHLAILQSQEDNGPITDWRFEDNDAGSVGVPNFRKKYIDVYLKSLSTYKYSSRYLQNSAGQELVYCGPTFDDVSVTPAGWGYWLCRHATTTAEVKGLNYFYILVDLNGPKAPNRVGRDIFYFPINHTGAPEKGLLSGNKNISDDSFKKNCHDASKTGNGYSSSWSTGSTCSLWIMHNNWKIPEKDYPW